MILDLKCTAHVAAKWAYVVLLGIVLVACSLSATGQAQISYLGTWGSQGTGNGQFEDPWSVAVGPTGNVYVSELLNFSGPGEENRIQEFDRSGNYLAQKNGGYVVSTAVSNAGTLYYAAASQEVIADTSDLQVDLSYWVNNWDIMTLAVAPNGNVLVGSRHDVEEYTAAGSPVTQWVPLVDATNPDFMAVNPTTGNVFLSDSGNGLVQSFDSSGNFQAAWHLASPTGIAVSGTGSVYVADNAANTITKFDSSGNVLATFGSPGSGAGQLNSPNGVAVAPTGDIYVADGGNNRIEHFFDPSAWVSGSNTFTNAAVGSGQLLGSSLTLSTGKTLTVNSITTINSGATLSLAGGTFNTAALILNGPAASLQVNSGSLNVGTFAINNGASYQVANGQTLNVGTTVLGSGSTLTVNGTLVSPQLVQVSGVLSGSGQVAGPLANQNGGEVSVGAAQQLWFSSTTQAENGGLIDAIGSAAGLAQVRFSGPLLNDASTGLITTQGGANLRFDGGLGNNGALAASFGQTNIFGDITNNASGKITIAAGANATFYGDVVQNGSLAIAPGSTAEVFGAFSGSGGFTGGGTLRQDGDLRPGNSPALVTFGGSLVIGASSTYQMQLGGTTIGSQYDSVRVTGAATLGGTLEVDLINGFHPALGQQFTALTYGSASGNFASYSGLAVGGHLTLHSAFVGAALLLTARPTIDGDINTDGVVNGLDIADVASHWLQNVIQGDANGDGLVNGLDIALIASNWLKTDSSEGAESAAAVPEPSTVSLFVWGGVALAGAIRRRHPRRRRTETISA